jgi:hypothetical protein
MLELELRSVPAQAAPPSNTSSTAQANIIIEVNQAIDSHDWRTLTQMTVDGLVNYSGHRHVTNAYIAQDMQNDSRTYERVHSTTYPNTFTHEVSDQYSSYWNGPMLYDSINVYSEAQERNGKLHRAMIADCLSNRSRSDFNATKWSCRNREKTQGLLHPDLHAPVFFAALVRLVRCNRDG